ncbi:ATP-grasp fold amidoligase family protein [Sphingomonas sp. TREG-RG-20F-R18-01]|uniref:ATP-grasp fold amidoligase family protein n=1 Tax=Sphingomonas sp. TREG-RG-20F-R18-01 TaxID=2914982 RepID=UPI001F56E7B9
MLPVALPPRSFQLGAHARIRLTYAWRHGRLPDLRTPRLFTELVQWRKLNDRDLRLPLLADKVAVKAVVADRLGRAWVVPTLWDGAVLPAERPDGGPIVVKSRHGCNQRVFVRDGTCDWPMIRRQAARWVDQRYGGWLDEWLYREIPPGVLIEPFIGADGQLPIDYKFYVFGGVVAFIQVHLEREHRHRWIVLDRHWRCEGDGTDLPPRPSALGAMIAAAENLGQGFDFVRVDFYQPDDVPLFGEMTFYPGSGLDPFDPPHLDAVMGDLWLQARGRATGVSQDFGGVALAA